MTFLLYVSTVQRSHPALLVLQAETRLTVYRLLAIRGRYGASGPTGRKETQTEKWRIKVMIAQNFNIRFAISDFWYQKQVIAEPLVCSKCS